MQSGLAEAARAESSWPDKKEWEPCPELSTIRVVFRFQKTRSSGLLRSKQVPIGLLPVELLSRIFQFTINEGMRKTELAAVSRFWRNIIINSPTLWTQITLTQSWTVPRVMAHVARSRECPLDITIGPWSCGPAEAHLLALLDPLIPCAHRWRSLVISWNRYQRIKSILSRIRSIAFPSLSHLCVGNGNAYAQLFPPERTPFLEQLELEWLTSRRKAPGSQVVVSTASSNLATSPPPMLLPYKTLSKLTLSGSIDHWVLGPRTIDLPLLTSLRLAVNQPWRLIDAVVAPRLTSFACDLHYVNRTTPRRPVVLPVLLGHFCTVHHLEVGYTGYSQNWSPSDAQMVCLSSPRVRHIEIPADHLPVFFGKMDGSCAVNPLEQLEVLSIRKTEPESLEKIATLVSWLRQRKLDGRCKLYVRLNGFDYSELPNDEWHATLRECCILESEEEPHSSERL